MFNGGRNENDGNCVPTHERQNAGDDQGREGADHINFTMGKINELDDAVDHGVAECNQRIDAAAG